MAACRVRQHPLDLPRRAARGITMLNILYGTNLVGLVSRCHFYVLISMTKLMLFRILDYVLCDSCVGRLIRPKQSHVGSASPSTTTDCESTSNIKFERLELLVSRFITNVSFDPSMGRRRRVIYCLLSALIDMAGFTKLHSAHCDTFYGSRKLLLVNMSLCGMMVREIRQLYLGVGIFGLLFGLCQCRMPRNTEKRVRRECVSPPAYYQHHALINEDKILYTFMRAQITERIF